MIFIRNKKTGFETNVSDVEWVNVQRVMPGEWEKVDKKELIQIDNELEIEIIEPKEVIENTILEKQPSRQKRGRNK